MTVIGGAPRSGELIQAALAAFVARWKSYQGTENALNKEISDGEHEYNPFGTDGDPTCAARRVGRAAVRSRVDAPGPSRPSPWMSDRAYGRAMR